MVKVPVETNNQEAPADEQAMQARRRLLRLGVYVPPAIVGMAILGHASNAFASVGEDDGKSGSGGSSGHTIGSCMPSACQPCIDYDDEEGKDKKDYDEYTHQGNKVQCEVGKAKKDYDDKHKKS